jgi:hypothetical protein
MENKLDKYFRTNLQDQRFELKEEYWLGAQKLLDEQDQLRTRRVAFWWFGSGLAVAILVLLLWCFLGKNVSNTHSASNAKIAAKSAPIVEPASPISEKDKSSEPTLANSGQAAQNGFEEKNKNKNEAHSTTSSALQSTDFQKIVKEPTSSIPVGKTPSPALNSNGQVSKKNAGSTQKLTGNSAEIITSIDPVIAQQKSNDEQALTADLAHATVKTVTKEQVQATDFLATPDCFVANNFAPNVPYANVQKIEVAEWRRLHFGLLASQLILPSPNKDEATFIGQRTGLVLKYHLRGRWHLGSGIQYLRRTGTFSASKSALQRNYRFGLELDTLLLRPTSLHYASIPITLGWELNRHQIEGGFLLDFLTGVRGEAGSFQKQGEPPVKTFTSDKSGWVTADGYARFTPTIQLAYGYQFAKRFSIGISANYTDGGFLDKGFTPPAGSFLLKETGKFQVGTQVVYLFN